MIEKRGSRYRAKFHIGNGKRISKTFETKQEAEAWKKLMSAKKTLGELKPNESKKSVPTLFVDLIANWYKSEVVGLSAASISQYKTSVRKYFLPFLHDKPIEKISVSDCDQVSKFMMEQKLAPRTFNRNVILLKQIFNYAIKRDLIIKSPARHLNNMKVQSFKEDHLSESEINLLLKLAKDEWFYGPILMALNTGMRLGEVAGLQWDMVDFENRLIHATRNLTKTGLNKHTKTHKKKAIPINDSLLSFLHKHKRSKLISKFVFVNETGQPIRPDHFTQRQLKSLIKGTKIEYCTFHTLRHTFASQFMMRGGSLFDLQKILGHSKIEMTMRYAHLCPDYLHDKIQIVNFG